LRHQAASGEIGELNAKGETYAADIERQFSGFWREDRHLSFFLAFLVLMTISFRWSASRAQGELQ
jgi:hypothetical protein